MKNFLKKQREILAILAYVILIGALFYSVVFPVLKKIGQTRDKIQEEQIKQEGNKKHLEELPKFKEQYKSLENVDFKQYLLDKNNAVVLIEKLEALAAQSGNKINITVQDQDLNKNVGGKAKKGQETTLTSELSNDNYLQFKIVINGDFNSIFKFIKILENFDYNSDIIGLSIRSNKVKTMGTINPFSSNDAQNKESSDGKLEATLDAVFYAK